MPETYKTRDIVIVVTLHCVYKLSLHLSRHPSVTIFVVKINHPYNFDMRVNTSSVINVQEHFISIYLQHSGMLTLTSSGVYINVTTRFISS